MLQRENCPKVEFPRKQSFDNLPSFYEVGWNISFVTNVKLRKD